jgi:hypothetical protein
VPCLQTSLYSTRADTIKCRADAASKELESSEPACDRGCSSKHDYILQPVQSRGFKEHA